MSTDALPPVVIGDVLAELLARLEAFRSAFARGPRSGREALALWEQTRRAEAECERTRELLAGYEAVLAGLLWAHYPDEYREKVHPTLNRIEGLRSPESAVPKRKGILREAREVLLARENRPVSISELVEELHGRGVRFRAREPAKSLGQAMRNSGKFEAVGRGIYRLKQSK